MCGILCCFGCLTCMGCRDRVCHRLVFFPPNPMYTVEVEKKDMELQVMWMLDENGNKNQPYSSPDFKIDFVKTRKKNVITTMFISYPKARVTILFSHGNAIDIGAMRDHLLEMSHKLHVNVFTYDYSGYGMSTGKPSPSNVLADAEAAFNTLTTKYVTDPNHKIIVYGQSLGSGPSMHLAVNYKTVSGVVLHSGMMSAVRVVRNVENTKWFDIFPNIDYVKKTNAPVFVIHGTQDQEIPVRHGIELSENANNPYEPWIVPGGGHNNIEVHWRDEYFSKLKAFIISLDTKSKEKEEKEREKEKDIDDEHTEKKIKPLSIDHSQSVSIRDKMKHNDAATATKAKQKSKQKLKRKNHSDSDSDDDDDYNTNKNNLVDSDDEIR